MERVVRGRIALVAALLISAALPNPGVAAARSAGSSAAGSSPSIPAFTDPSTYGRSCTLVDAFQRLDTAGWGTSDSGFAWQGSAGAGVSPGFAYLAYSSGPTAPSVQLDVPGRDIDPLDMLVQGRISGLIPSEFGVGLGGDWVSLSNFSAWDQPPTNLDLHLPWTLLIHREAGLIAARIWQSGAAEPSDWQYSASSEVNPAGSFLAAFNYGQGGGATRLIVTSVNISGPGACAPPPAGKSTSCTITDTFQRSRPYDFGGGWGTSDGGFPWVGDAWTQITPGSASIQQAGGSEGVYAWEALVAPHFDKAPFDLMIDGDFSRPFIRGQGYNDAEFGKAEIEVAGAGVALYHWVPGEDHINEVPINVDLGRPWTLQVHREPGVLQFKIWQVGQTVPSEWQQSEMGPDAESDPWITDYSTLDPYGRVISAPNAVLFHSNPAQDNALNIHHLQITGTVSGAHSCAPSATNKVTIWDQGDHGPHSASIVTSGPLTKVQIGDDLNCAVNYAGDANGEFYGDTACGTFVAVDGQVFGPADVFGNGTQRTPYTPISQRLEQSGDTSTILTQVALGTTGVSLYESDQYKAGDSHYDTGFSIVVSGEHRVVVFHAADCNLADSGNGYGYRPPDGIGVGCQALSDTSRTAVWAGASQHSWQWMEGDSQEIWQRIASGVQFPYTVRSLPGDVHDTAAGLSWDLGIPEPGAKVSEQSTLTFGSAAAPPGYSSGCSDTRPWDSAWYRGDTTPQWVFNKDESQTFKMTSGDDIGRYVTSGHGGISLSFTLPYEGPTDASGYPTAGNRFLNKKVRLNVSAFDVDSGAACSGGSVSGFRPEKDALLVNGYGEDEWLLTGSDQASTLNSIEVPANLLHFATKRDGTGALSNSITINVGDGAPADQWGVRVDEVDVTLPPPAATDHPVVLLHGLNGINDNGTNEMTNLAKYFQAQGLKVINPNQSAIWLPGDIPVLNTKVISLGSLQDDLDHVMSAVDMNSLYVDNGYAGAFVVGHSMGGLVGRYLISKTGCIHVGTECRLPFTKIVSLGTPHGGIPKVDEVCSAETAAKILGVTYVASILLPPPFGTGADAAGIAALAALGYACTNGAIPQLRPEWVKGTFNTSWAPYNGGYQFDQWVGTLNGGCFGGMMLYPDSIPSDGCVSVESQTGMSPKASVGLRLNIKHSDEPFCSNVGSELLSYLYGDLEPTGGCPPLPGANSATSSVSPSVSESDSQSAGTKVASLVTGVELAPGGTADIPLAFEGSSEASVYVTDNNYDLDATFSGTDLSPSGLGFLTTSLSSPPAGTLHIVNNGTQVETVAVIVMIATDRQLTVTTTTDTASIGQSVPVDITLGAATADDEVTADLVDPNGGRASIVLTKVDTGHWTGQATPSTGGTNTIVVGTTTGATRWAQALIDVAGGGIATAGPMSATTVDLNSDYLADRLVVTVPVSVTKAGSYQVQATLADPSGSTVAQNIDGVFSLEAGSQTVTLTFQGSDIYASGKSGPYSVAEVTFLSDPTATDCRTEAQYASVGQTDPYDYHAFAHKQIVIDPASVSTSPVDGDANGYFEALSADGKVAVEHAGVYLVQAGLYAPDGTQVAQTSAQIDMVGGSNDFTLLFDGRDIWRAGKDGPYTVRNLTVGFAATPLSGDSLADSVTSSPYTVGQFTPPPTSAIDTTSIVGATGSTSVSVPFVASLPDSGSYVELWRRFQALGGSWSSWAKLATATSSPIAANLDAGDGTYEFATLAVDPTTGMSQAIPAVAQATVELDTTAPQSSVDSLPAASSDTTLHMHVSFSDDWLGVADVAIWERHGLSAGGYSDWTQVATTSSPDVTVTLDSGDLAYEFYSVAIDKAGNLETAPAGAQASTYLNPGGASSSVTTLASPIGVGSVSVSFTTSGSAASSVELWQRFKATGSAGWTDWTKAATAAASPFSVSLTSGDGRYEFYTIAVDSAGKREPAPAVADAYTDLDSHLSATHLSVSSASPIVAGSANTITVTALDAYGNTATGFTGTVHFTTSEPGAMVPADYTFTAADAGVHSYADNLPYALRLYTVGTHSLTATDTVNPAITASESVTVNPAAATHLGVTGYPTSTVAGAAHTLTVTALDAYGNTATTYTGTVAFTSSDGGAVLPANSTLTGGVGTFSVTLKTAGTRSVTATDTLNPAITGTGSGIAVTSATATHLSVAGYPASTVAGVAHTLTVTAIDPYGNAATTYTGTVAFTSSDGGAVLPANSTLTGGVGTFSVTLKSAGTRSVTATDTVNSAITGFESVAVTSATATHLSVSSASPTVAGAAHDVTVTALDAYGNTATTYTGTVAFTSSDGGAILPANSTLTGGVGTFSVTLKTAGTRSVTATDTVNYAITGTGSLTVTAAAAATFAVTGYPTSTVAGVAHNITVTAKDPYGNTATGYLGIAHFVTTDTRAVVPPDYTFTAADAGTHVFAVTLKTVGSQTIRARDTITSTLTGIQSNIAVTPAAAATFTLTGYPTSTLAGVAHNITVTARDLYGNTATGYTGTVHFTSTDAQAVLPVNLTLTAGVGTFSVTLKTAGSRSVTATDTVTGSITGTGSGIAVTPAAATTFTVTGYPTSTVAGVAHNITVTAKDPYGNTATGYRGIAHFVTTDTKAVVPPDYTFLATDAGTHVFAVTLKTVGSQTIRARDTITSTLTGTQSAITVTPAAATTFTVTGYPTSTVAGVAHNITVTARDPYGNIATGYRGIAHFLTTDTRAVVPPDYTFLATDAGTHVFAVTLKTAGSQTIRARDTITSTLTGTQSAITVTPAAATTFTVTGYPTSTVAGVAHNITVTARDAYGNIATGYRGIAHFVTTDTRAVVPPDYTFTAGDAGTHVFAVTLKTAGSQTIRARDTITSTLTGTQSGILVS